MNRFISITLQADLAYTRIVSSLAGQVAESFASNAGMTGNIQEFCHAFELSASESFTNSVRYGDPSDTERKITVDFSTVGDSLTVMVTDTNPGFEPHPPAPDIASYPEKGYGLFIIARMMDEVSYSRVEGKNTLSMSKQVLKPVVDVE
jgi:anti-sigma regulatory factor (Ser/Thr protein kinase)